MCHLVPRMTSGKKSELPLARYVCDFLRATIFASDPYVLAVTWPRLGIKGLSLDLVKKKLDKKNSRLSLD